MNNSISLLLFSCLALLLSHPNTADGFLTPPSRTASGGGLVSHAPTSIVPSHHVTHHHSNSLLVPPLNLADELAPEPISVIINTTLSDTNTKKLFAWIKCAFDYDESDKNDAYAYYYNNIELAIAAAFGDNLPENSLPAKLLQMAMKKEGLSEEKDAGKMKEWEELVVGDEVGRRDRESASLGAMGAGQWTGQFMTRPHCKYTLFAYYFAQKSHVLLYRVYTHNLIIPTYLQHCWISETTLPSMTGSKLSHEGVSVH